MAIICEHIIMTSIEYVFLYFVLRIYQLSEKYIRNLISDMHV